MAYEGPPISAADVMASTPMGGMLVGVPAGALRILASRGDRGAIDTFKFWRQMGKDPAFRPEVPSQLGDLTPVAGSGIGPKSLEHLAGSGGRAGTAPERILTTSEIQRQSRQPIGGSGKFNPFGAYLELLWDAVKHTVNVRN